MRYLFLLLSIGTSLLSLAQMDSTNIDIQTIELSEAEAIAEKTNTMPTHFVIVPTESEKEHATNAFELIYNTNISALDISFNGKQIFNNLGQDVVLCIDGIEASPEEIETLRSKNILSIEFQRTPSGMYSGRGGILNFKTIPYEYGGNIFASAKESFLYNSGDYIASADYSHNNSRIVLIYSNDWGLSNDKQVINNTYTFANGDMLTKIAESNPIKSKSFSNNINIRISNKGSNYRFSLLGALSDSRTPCHTSYQDAHYSGILQNKSFIIQSSSNEGKAFALKANYSLWLPKEQIIDLHTSMSLGYNSYNYSYHESLQNHIQSGAKENNKTIGGTLQYFKTFKNGITFSSVINHNHTRYDDLYEGYTHNKLMLENNTSALQFQISNTTENKYYYISAGISNMNTRLNQFIFNYTNPILYYGLNYTPKRNTSISLSGYYINTLFDPSNKNNLSLQTSFFEITRGNPDLKPINVLSHTIEYTKVLGNTSLTASYKNYIYFNNILHSFETDDNYVYTNTINDGDFYGNMLRISLSHRMFEDKLNISFHGIEEYNIIKGSIYTISQNVLRAQSKIDYSINKLHIGLNIVTPYKALDIREPYFIKTPMKTTIYTTWHWQNWKFEACLNTPFNKYSVTERYMSHPCYDMNITDYSLQNGRSISIKTSFNFGYGKKVAPENYSIERTLNSAIFKSY